MRVSGFKFVSSLSVRHDESDGWDPGKCQERCFQLREGNSGLGASGLGPDLE